VGGLGVFALVHADCLEDVVGFGEVVGRWGRGGDVGRRGGGLGGGGGSGSGSGGCLTR